MSILIDIGTVLLIFVSLFLMMVVLAQKSTSDGGMGAAMGGGMAEAAFGAETGNVLTKSTINAAIVFFVLSFLVYLGNVYQHKHSVHATRALPTIPTSTAPAFPGTAPAANALSAPAVQPIAPSAAPIGNPSANK